MGIKIEDQLNNINLGNIQNFEDHNFEDHFNNINIFKTLKIVTLWIILTILIFSAYNFLSIETNRMLLRCLKATKVPLD